MWRDNPPADRVSVARDEQWPVPHARRREGCARSRRARWRHGERSHAAAARRAAIRQFFRDCEELLTRIRPDTQIVKSAQVRPGRMSPAAFERKTTQAAQ